MYYQTNKETGKLELIFSKEEYQALPDSMKAKIKSNFLFSRSLGGWVSRCKFPNLYSAEHVAKELGAEDRGKIGETLSFAEQQERKAERAEARAERMEYRSELAEKRGDALQKPIHDMHGDIAFFTQPNINTSAGRAFTNRRNKMFAAYDRGFEEFKKSAYYAERAEKARETAAGTKPKDKGFCMRRIEEAQKTVRAQKKNLEHYEGLLEQLDQKGYVDGFYWSREDMTAEKIQKWIENAEEIIEQAISKEIYYRECLEDLGGVQFDKSNLKAGDLIKISRWKELVRFLRGGTKNFTYEFTLSHMKYADGTMMRGQAAYAEIECRVAS